LRPGEYVVAIDEERLTDQTNLSRLLNDKAGEPLRLQVSRFPDGRDSRIVEIRPIRAIGSGSALLPPLGSPAMNAWLPSLSNGRLGYIHLRAMDFESLDEFVRALYSEHFDKGWADPRCAIQRWRIYPRSGAFLFRGQRTHLLRQPRGVSMARCYSAPYDRKWTKPVVVLCNNRSFSDAEIFPNAFRELGLGKLVGVPTGGLVIGTVNERLIDGSFFRVPRLGVYTPQGINMEKAGVVPDIVVEPHPDDLQAGRDPQLTRAVEVLKQEVRDYFAKRKPVPLPVPGASESRP
jgi:tricorn protease